MLMAGLDGIRNKMHPGDAADGDLFALAEDNERSLPTVAFSLEEALNELDADREFLTAGDVITSDCINAYIELKSADVKRLRKTTHPVEFDMYYSL
jgi:glutamine synthetase